MPSSRCFAELTPLEVNRLLILREEVRARAQALGFSHDQCHEAAAWAVIASWRRVQKDGKSEAE